MRVVRVAGRIGSQLVPERGGLVVFAAAFCEERQFAAGLRAKFGGQAEVEGLCAGVVCAIALAALVQESVRDRRDRG